MTVQMPEVSTHHTPDAKVVEPSAHVSHGGGDSNPGCSGPPATAGRASAHTNTADAQNASSLLMIDSPVEVTSGQGGFAARTAEYTPESPEDLARFRTLMFTADYKAAAHLCRERLFTSRDPLTSLRWTKDYAIVMRALGQYDHALELICTVLGIASNVEGTARGKFENGFGRSLELTGHVEDALDRYDVARVHHLQDGEELRAAEVDVNKGRAFIAKGEPSKSHFYFGRALTVARTHSDKHLEGEIHESIALAYEAEGRFVEAEASAYLSVQLISQTGDRTALEESVRTWQRVGRR